MFPNIRKKSSLTATKILFSVTIMLGSLFSISTNGLSNIFEKQLPASSPTVAPRPGKVTDKMWVYFTQPENPKLDVTVKDIKDKPKTSDKTSEWDKSMEKYLIDEISRAEKSIYIASYEGSLTPVMEALISRKKAVKGMDIRWVTDDASCDVAQPEAGAIGRPEWCESGFLLLRNAGIEVRSDGLPLPSGYTTQRKAPTPIMHDKFLIFDDKIVWTGSTNLTESGIYSQHNNTVVIESSKLAEIYKEEFNEMWDWIYGIDSPSPDPKTDPKTVTLSDNTQIKVFFTPDSSDPGTNGETATEKIIIPIVSKATKNIYFMAYSFTDKVLAKAIIDRAKNNNVSIQGIFDSGQKGTDRGNSQIDVLACAKNVKMRSDWAIMHSKVIVVDEKYVITGSLNFSNRANTQNDENVVIIDSSKLATFYINEFKRIWDAKNPNDDKDRTTDYVIKCSS